MLIPGKHGRPRYAFWWMWALLVCAMALTACGDDDGAAIVDAGFDDDAGDVTPLAMAEFCAARETAFCAVQGECTFCDDLEDGPVGFFRRTCERSVQAATDGRMTFDGRAAARCVNAISAATCSTGVGPGRLFQLDPCPRVFVGAVSPGQACVNNGANECRDGYCDTQEACPGECIAYQGLDEACDTTDKYCQDDLVCDEARCKRRLPNGHECTLVPGACERGLTCLPIDSAGTSQCARLGAVGDACVNHEGCAFPLACDGTRCQASVDSGQACRSDNNCADNRRCYAPNDEAEPTCEPLLAIDALCPSGAGCPTGTQCAGDQTGERRCRPRAAAGEPCDFVGCEDDLRCIYGDNGGVCRAPLPLNAACTDGQQCESNLCRDEACAAPGPVGATCNAYQGTGVCAENLYCRPNSADSGEGTCRAREAAGGDCQVSIHGWQVCGAGLFCQCDLGSLGECNDVPGHLSCVALFENGDDCDNHNQCASEACIAGVCKDQDELTAVERACIQTN